jgi:uncharacterized protein YciI
MIVNTTQPENSTGKKPMFFVVVMSHPDGDGWVGHVRAHVDYLKCLVSQGKLRASGRAISLPQRAGLLIFKVDDRAELDRLIACDPFAIEGLITDLTVVEWDPLFGVFAAESSAATAP